MGAIYRGWRDDHGGWHVAGNTRPLPLTGIAADKGSPTWGYHGSGAASLAFALLAAEVGEEIAATLYKAFRDDVVAVWHRDLPWRMHSYEIRGWLTSHITTRRMLAGMHAQPAPLVGAQVTVWAEGTSVEDGWPEVVSVLTTGQLALGGAAVASWSHQGELARLHSSDGVVWCEMEPILRLRELVPPRIAGLELRLLRYPAIGAGLWLPHRYAGRCLVRWRRWHGPEGPQAVAVVSELTGELGERLGVTNDSTAITNRVSWLATALRQELDVPPAQLAYIEHLPARGRKVGGRWQIDGDFSLVTVDWKASPPQHDAPGGMAWYAHDARWTYLSRPRVESRLGTLLDDTAAQAA